MKEKKREKKKKLVFSGFESIFSARRPLGET